MSTPTAIPKLLGDSRFPDVELMLNKQKFSCHSPIVGARCPDLIAGKAKDQLSKRTKRGKPLAIDVAAKVATPTSLSNLLVYVYTGDVPLDKMKITDILELWQIAQAYHQDRLMYLCRSHVKKGLSMANVFETLKEAHKYKVEPIKADSVAFSLANYTTFITNDGAKVLGVDLFQEVVTSQAQNKSSTTDLGPEPPDTLNADFQQIYDKTIFPDVTAQCKDEKVRFHAAILGVNSPVFAELLNPSKGDPPAGFDFKIITANAFKAMMRFLYYGDKQISPLLACELINPSREWKLGDLHALCKVILETNVNQTTAVEIVKQCCHPNLTDYGTIVENVTDFVVRNLATLNIDEIRKLEVTQAHHVSYSLLVAFQAYAKHNAGRPAAPAAAPSPAPAAASSDSSSSLPAAAAATASGSETSAAAAAAAATPAPAAHTPSKKDGSAHHKEHKSSKNQDKKTSHSKRDEKKVSNDTAEVF